MNPTYGMYRLRERGQGNVVFIVLVLVLLLVVAVVVAIAFPQVPGAIISSVLPTITSTTTETETSVPTGTYTSTSTETLTPKPTDTVTSTLTPTLTPTASATPTPTSVSDLEYYIKMAQERNQYLVISFTKNVAFPPTKHDFVPVKWEETEETRTLNKEKVLGWFEGEDFSEPTYFKAWFQQLVMEPSVEKNVVWVHYQWAQGLWGSENIAYPGVVIYWEPKKDSLWMLRADTEGGILNIEKHKEIGKN